MGRSAGLGLKVRHTQVEEEDSKAIADFVVRTAICSDTTGEASHRDGTTDLCSQSMVESSK